MPLAEATNLDTVDTPITFLVNAASNTPVNRRLFSIYINTHVAHTHTHVTHGRFRVNSMWAPVEPYSLRFVYVPATRQFSRNFTVRWTEITGISHYPFAALWTNAYLTVALLSATSSAWSGRYYFAIGISGDLKCIRNDGSMAFRKIECNFYTVCLKST